MLKIATLSIEETTEEFLSFLKGVFLTPFNCDKTFLEEYFGTILPFLEEYFSGPP